MPPSSSMTRLRPDRAFMSQPTRGLPVKLSTLKRSSVTSLSPTGIDIGAMVTEPGSAPLASMILASFSRANGVWLGILSTIGQPTAIAGAPFVRGQAQRQVERADARDGTSREAPGDPHAAAGDLVEAEVDDLTGDAFRLGRGDAERHRGPFGLGPGVLDRLARLLGKQPGSFLVLLSDPLGDRAQHRGALVPGPRAAADWRRRPWSPAQAGRPWPRSWYRPAVRPPGSRLRSAGQTSSRYRRGTSARDRQARDRQALGWRAWETPPSFGLSLRARGHRLVLAQGVSRCW